MIDDDDVKCYYKVIDVQVNLHLSLFQKVSLFIFTLLKVGVLDFFIMINVCGKSESWKGRVRL